jgi:hypothetical protein
MSLDIHLKGPDAEMHPGEREHVGVQVQRFIGVFGLVTRVAPCSGYERVFGSTASSAVAPLGGPFEISLVVRRQQSRRLSGVGDDH